VVSVKKVTRPKQHFVRTKAAVRKARGVTGNFVRNRKINSLFRKLSKDPSFYFDFEGRGITRREIIFTFYCRQLVNSLKSAEEHDNTRSIKLGKNRIRRLNESGLDVHETAARGKVVFMPKDKR